MKITPFRVIAALNLLIIAAIYLAPMGNQGGYLIVVWAMLTVVHVVANLALAAVTGILAAVLGAKNTSMKGVPLAFLICAGLVLLISFPLCFAMSSIHH